MFVNFNLAHFGVSGAAAFAVTTDATELGCLV
jgi:hypothetical protein